MATTYGSTIGNNPWTSMWQVRHREQNADGDDSSPSDDQSTKALPDDEYDPEEMATFPGQHRVETTFPDRTVG